MRALPVLWLMVLPMAGEAQVEVDRYAYETPFVASVRGAEDLIEELRAHVDEVLGSPHLGPIRTYYADLDYETYYLYTEPGRIIATLAMAYPYLTTSQQTSVRAYVRAECANPLFAPWSAEHLARDAGSPRARWQAARLYGPDFPRSRPLLHTLYGLWLYGYASGDWTLVQPNWPSIRAFYEDRRNDGAIYGPMSGHIAMVRLAHRAGDTAMRDQARSALQTALSHGLDFSYVENRCWNLQPNYWDSPYREHWDSRKDGLVYRGFMFLNLCPEIGRFLADRVRRATLTRHREAERMFPKWWLAAAPYWSRHSGDEGSGLPSEMHGMVAPVSRWVDGTSAEKLRSYMASAPVGKGDCYWMEALVMAIEAHGETRWVDARRPKPPSGLGSK